MKRWLTTTGLLMLACGCQSVGSKPSTDFISPLAGNDVNHHDTQATPGSERELCVQTATMVASRGHITEAIALYEQAERLRPELAKLNRELAPLYPQAGRWESALARYQAAIDASPDDAELLNNFCWTLLEADQSSRALEVAVSGVERFPGDRRLRSTLALAHHRCGNREAALEQMRDLYGAAAALHNIALFDIDAGDHVAARAAVAQSLAHDPTPRATQLASALESTLASQHDR